MDEVDICILGGSCTGVSAAIRAARLGASVAIVEQQNCFGGTATAGMVCIWHPLLDTQFSKKIIGGVTEEILKRLKKRNAVEEMEEYNLPYRMNNILAFRINTEEMKIELDEMIIEAKIVPYLHTYYSAPLVKDGKLEAIIVENKSGRSAISAKYFIDATGDSDLCVHLGISSYSFNKLQPATTCARIYGFHRIKDFDYYKTIQERGKEFNVGFPGWSSYIPGVPEVTFLAETTVHKNCSDGKDLTQAEIEGRRQVRAIMDTIRKYCNDGEKISLLALGSHIGIRDTRRIKCIYQLTKEDVLYGKKFTDAIANSAYPIDIHHDDKSGATYRYLDGFQEYDNCIDYPLERTRWRDDEVKYPTYWQIPYKSMTPDSKYNNILVCGRGIDTDIGAFGATRVMINCNQTGEAAGVACVIAMNDGKGVNEVDVNKLRKELAAGGSIIL